MPAPVMVHVTLENANVLTVGKEKDVKFKHASIIAMVEAVVITPMLKNLHVIVKKDLREPIVLL